MYSLSYFSYSDYGKYSFNIFYYTSKSRSIRCIVISLLRTRKIVFQFVDFNVDFSVIKILEC